MILYALSKRLQKLLERHGRIVAKRPLPFLLTPLILTTLFSYGFAFLEKLSSNQDALEMYTSNHGQAKSWKNRIIGEFGNTWRSESEPMNGVTCSVILTRRTRDILSQEFVAEYLRLRQALEAVQVQVKDVVYSYADLCWKDPIWDGRNCSPDIFQITTLRGLQGYQDLRLLKFPTATLRSPTTGADVRLRVPLGGVETTPLGFIRSAEAAIMNFHFPYIADTQVLTTWELKFRSILMNWKAENLRINYFSSAQLNVDLGKTGKSLQYLLPCLLFVLSVFCVACSCVADWVHSKPCLGLAAVLTALASVVSAFGFCMLCQVPLLEIVYVVPFLVFTVAIHDMFLMLAVWRKTNCTLPVEERMALTFSDAAVSMTLTSAASVSVFIVGAFTPFLPVRYFSIYAVICFAFCYAYKLSLLAACMAYSGIREAQNRHCFMFNVLPTSVEAADRNFWFKVFCTGGDGRTEEFCDCRSSVTGATTVLSRSRLSLAHCDISPKDNMCNKFFRYRYAPLLRLKCIRILAAVCYLLYLGVAVWGVSTLRTGTTSYGQLLTADSTSTAYLRDYEKYFIRYALPLEVVITGYQLDMNNPYVQQATLDLAARLENTRFTERAELWLRDFLIYVASESLANRNFGASGDFFDFLGPFITNPAYQAYAQHFYFRAPRHLSATRFLVPVTGIPFGQERAFLDEVKDILASSSLNVSAYHASFQPGEQQAAVLPLELQSVGIAVGVVIIASFFLIPSVTCSLSVSACIVSINLGVLGAMSLWDVDLDILSIICILMSIGISVGFVAHISFSYVQAMEQALSAAKAERALGYLGVPILQAGLGSVCGLSILLAIPGSISEVFVKTIILTAGAGMFHGLVLLPIILSLFLRDKPPTTQCPSTTSKSIGSTACRSGILIPGLSRPGSVKDDSGLARTTSSTSIPSSVYAGTVRSSSIGSARVTFKPEPLVRGERQKRTASALSRKAETNVSSTTAVSNTQIPLAPAGWVIPSPGYLYMGSEATKAARVMNWLMQNPSAGSYPANSVSSLTNNGSHNKAKAVSGNG